MGVLQRVALAYGIGAIICLSVNRSYLWIVTAFLLLAYWALLAFFDGAEPYSLEGNIAAGIDAALLGKEHLSGGFGIPFDPEGLSATLPAVCTVMIGYYIGGIVGKGSSDGKTALKLLLLGTAASGLGLLWSNFFPLNRPLWSSSYVLYSAGLAMGVLALIYFITEVLKFRKWSIFFLVFGTNALFSYYLATSWTKMMHLIRIPSGDTSLSLYSRFYEKVCVPIAGNMGGSLMFAIIQMFIIWLIVLLLYRKRIFIRL